MSDFGSLIVAIKISGGSFDEGELENLSDKLKDLIESKGLKNSLGEEYNHEFSSEPNGEAAVRLSDYYFSDSEEEDLDSLEFVRDVEGEDIDVMLEELKTSYTSFDFSSAIEFW